MRLGERWIWVGDTTSAEQAGVVVYFDHPGQWWLARDTEMAGPFGDGQILRALRIACTPVIDGCEKGPPKSGFLELENRRAHKARPRQYERAAHELLPSVTAYDAQGLEPAVGCCTRFDALPRVAWGPIAGWDAYRDRAPAHAGVLERSWNAHPRGSLVFCNDEDTLAELTVVDLPDSDMKTTMRYVRAAEVVVQGFGEVFPPLPPGVIGQPDWPEGPATWGKLGGTMRKMKASLPGRI